MRANTLRVIFILVISFFSNHFCFSQNKDMVSDKILIVLDIQEYYTVNKLSELSAQKYIDSVNYVISRTDANNIIYVKSRHKLLNLTLRPPFIFVTLDSSAMRFDKRLNLVNDNIFMKDISSAFESKELTSFLKQNNAKEIIIIGLMAEQCLYESLISGKELGYDMYVIPEAIVGKSLKSKAKVVEKLTKKGIKILDLNTL